MPKLKTHHQKRMEFLQRQRLRVLAMYRLEATTREISRGRMRMSHVKSIRDSATWEELAAVAKWPFPNVPRING
jgi:hypothetical protein